MAARFAPSPGIRRRACDSLPACSKSIIRYRRPAKGLALLVPDELALGLGAALFAIKCRGFQVAAGPAPGAAVACFLAARTHHDRDWLATLRLCSATDSSSDMSILRTGPAMGHSMVNAALQMSLGRPRGGERVHACVIRPGLSGSGPVHRARVAAAHAVGRFPPSPHNRSRMCWRTRCPTFRRRSQAETWRTEGWRTNRTFDAHRRVVRLSENPCRHAAARPSARGGGEQRRLECRQHRRLCRTTRHSDGYRRRRTTAAVAQRPVQRHRRGRAGRTICRSRSSPI